MPQKQKKTRSSVSILHVQNDGLIEELTRQIKKAKISKKEKEGIYDMLPVYRRLKLPESEIRRWVTTNIAAVISTTADFKAIDRLIR